MAYTRYVYNRVNWKNKSESLETPLGKTNLNRMDSAIYNIAENLDVAYNEFSAGKFDKADADKVIVGMPTWDSDTGILTFRFYDGTEFSVDFNIEKIPVSFSMDSAGVITMTTADGTEWTADIGSLIPDYVFADSDRIAFTKTKNADGSYSVSADIKKNSITGNYLQPDYLADVTTQASNAAESAKSASDSADSAAYDAKLSQSYAIGGSGIREGEDDDCAKKYKEDAEAAKISAESFKNSAKESAASASSSASSALESKGVAESAKEESQNSAKESAASASSSASSAVISAEKATESSNSASSSSASAESSEKSAVKSESFAKGGTGTREGEDGDNAKYYYEQTKRISQSQSGVVPMGTISFSGLSDEENQKSGYMFNISDSFVSDERFTDGGGIFYGAGNNVIYTADGKWDALAASSVTGVKGASESTYRQGNVNITKSDIGLALVENTEDRNKNVKSARKILDEGNLNEISVQYSGTGIQSAEWLAAWNGYKIEAIHMSNVSVGNADTVDGYHVWDGQAYPYDKPYIPLVKDDGVMEVGRYMDFHIQGSSADYDARFNIDSAGNFELSSPAYAPKIVASRAFAGYGEEQFLVANPTYPNASVKAYVDKEGANFRLTPNNANNYYEFDTLEEGFRLYHYYNGATPILISSVGSGANLELQIGRATKDGSGNNIVNTYATKTDLNTLKNSVSDGKKKVANAITAKGISTPATATFDTMATNIGKIVTNGGYAQGAQTIMYRAESWSGTGSNTNNTWGEYLCGSYYGAALLVTLRTTGYSSNQFIGRFFLSIFQSGYTSIVAITQRSSYIVIVIEKTAEGDGGYFRTPYVISHSDFTNVSIGITYKSKKNNGISVRICLDGTLRTNLNIYSVTTSSNTVDHINLSVMLFA